MKYIQANPQQWLKENEQRLQMEYAKLRRLEFIKKGKRCGLDKQSDMIAKEWSSFTAEQKINMQRYLDKKMKKRSIKDGYKGHKFQKMKDKFNKKNDTDFDNLAEKDLIEEVDEMRNKDLNTIIRTGNNPGHYGKVSDIIA